MKDCGNNRVRAPGCASVTFTGFVREEDLAPIQDHSEWQVWASSFSRSGQDIPHGDFHLKKEMMAARP
jgi:hypothetical protein